MPAKKQLKQYTLDAKKVKRVQKYLKAETEEAAINQALDIMLDNWKIDRAHERFFKDSEKGEIVDVYGRLPQP